MKKQKGKSVNTKTKISDKGISTNKDNRSTGIITGRNRIVQKMVGKDMMRKQPTGSSRKLCVGITMDKEFLDGYLDKHAAELKMLRSWLAYSILNVLWFTSRTKHKETILDF